MPIDVTGFIKKVTKVKKCFCRWDKNDKISFQGGEEVDVAETYNLNVIIFLRCFTRPEPFHPRRLYQGRLNNRWLKMELERLSFRPTGQGPLFYGYRGRVLSGGRVNFAFELFDGAV